MTDERKTKRQLVAELAEMRRQVAELRGRLQLLEGESVAERMEAEEALRQSNEFLQSVLENTPSSIFVRDLEGRYLLVNRQHQRVIGLSSEQAVGRRPEELHRPQAAAQIARNDRLVLESGMPFRSEEVVLVDDEPRTFIATKVPLRDASGQPYALCTVATDITERVRAEEALRESEMKLRLIFENAFDGISIYEEYPDRREHRLLDCNERYAEMAGRSKEELLEIGNTTLVQKKVSPARSRQESLQLRRERRSYQGIFSWIRPDGKENFVEYSASPIQVGERAMSIGVDRDITERVRAEEAMRQASRLEATATLAGGIAHDLNNLMVGVLGYAEMLKMDLADWRDALEMLEIISESAQRAAKLAQQMLAFARGGKYRPRVMSLNDTVLEALRVRRRSLPSSIHVEHNAAPDLWSVEADPTQMSEVVLNLFTNAVEAVGDGGRITIATSNRTLGEGDVADIQPGRYVCLSVQDTGCGMSENVRARIFEPFFTTKFQGRGMGLAAAYGIIENHGGHISVQSEEGQGATFEVYLPAVQGEAEPA